MDQCVFSKLGEVYLSLFDNGFLGKSVAGEWLFNGLPVKLMSPQVSKTSSLILAGG